MAAGVNCPLFRSAVPTYRYSAALSFPLSDAQRVAKSPQTREFCLAARRHDTVRVTPLEFDEFGGAVQDRDVNAARNILRPGRQALAEGRSIQTL
jgi:hypothetical protein